MKLFLQTLYCAFLVVSGLLFMRIIVQLVAGGSQQAWAKPIYGFTDVFVFPVGMLSESPQQLLYGTKGIVEPHAIITLFLVLIAAFLVSLAIGGLEENSPKKSHK